MAGAKLDPGKHIHVTVGIPKDGGLRAGHGTVIVHAPDGAAVTRYGIGDAGVA